MHVDIGQGTNFEVKIPWSVTEQGFQTKLAGTLMMIEAKTSLPFRDFLRCETLQINIDMNYPIKWNEHQEWVKKEFFVMFFIYILSDNTAQFDQRGSYTKLLRRS